ncbi:unnamed protein product [Lepidochelys olivacea]
MQLTRERGKSTHMELIRNNVKSHPADNRKSNPAENSNSRPDAKRKCCLGGDEKSRPDTKRKSHPAEYRKFLLDTKRKPCPVENRKSCADAKKCYPVWKRKFCPATSALLLSSPTWFSIMLPSGTFTPPQEPLSPHTTNASGCHTHTSHFLQHPLWTQAPRTSTSTVQPHIQGELESAGLQP